MSSSLSFLLKGVDLQKLVSDYNNGKYNRAPPDLAPIKFSVIENVITPTYSQSPQDDIYRTRGKYGEHIIVVTTNCQSYKRQLEHKPPKMGGRCSFCHQDFTHQALGYPVAHQEIINTVEGKVQVQQCFWVEDCFDTYECTLGFIRKTLGPSLAYRHDHLRDSESLLHYLFYLQFGKDKLLLSAPDPRLLQENGGPLSRKDWLQSCSIFIPSISRILLPAKSSFIQTL